MVSDPVADFIIRLKNAGMVGAKEVVVPRSKLKVAIAEKLRETGFVDAVSERGKKGQKTFTVTLRYDDEGRHAIGGVTRVSKPGRRLYTKAADIVPVKFGRGRRILSTPAGVLTGEEARAANVGGEELFIVW